MFLESRGKGWKMDSEKRCGRMETVKVERMSGNARRLDKDEHNS